jgi:uncharacterized protein YciI
MVLAFDLPGDDGPARRDDLRPAHAASIRDLWEEGRVVLGAGVLDEAGVVRGSLLVVDYPSREEVDGYLASEPFATGGLWDRVEVHPLRLPDFYLRPRP